MKVRSGLLVAASLLAALSVVPAHGAGSCAAPNAGAGEWRSYGGGADGTRSQDLESKLNPTTAANLKTKWVFNAATPTPDGGSFSNTPVVADGCVFLASATGWVFALNADDGTLVWKHALNGAGQTLLGGVIVGSVAVANGLVYAGVSDPGNPYVAAMSEFGDDTHAPGDEVWRTVIEGSKIGFPQGSSLINASPVLTSDGLIFQGFAGNEGGSIARGGFAVIDAFDGTLIKHTYTISDAEYAAGYRGASVWCTGAYDAATKYVYACGGNPASKQLEARYSNALLKIDLDRERGTFGTVVDAFKGNNEQYYPGLDHQPVCDTQPNLVPVSPWSVTCLQLDLDFGASPSLFTDSLGRTMVGDLQKSGIYHVVYADNMEQSWSALVGPPCPACNATSGAVDGARVYTVSSPGGIVYGLSKDQGRYQWALPLADPTHYQSASVANGVLYVLDTYGDLTAIDSATGLPVLRYNFAADAGGFAGDPSSQGIAIARNMVYVASGAFVFAMA